MSFELAPDNILVNSVCPALIHSPLWERLADSMVSVMGNNREQVYQNLANQFTALKRFGRAEEVSGLVVFLASDRASFITGSRFESMAGRPSRSSLAQNAATYLQAALRCALSRTT